MGILFYSRVAFSLRVNCKLFLSFATFNGMAGRLAAESNIGMEFAVVSLVMPCVIVERYSRFGRIFCLRNGDNVLSNNTVSHLEDINLFESLKSRITNVFEASWRGGDVTSGPAKTYLICFRTEL